MYIVTVHCVSVRVSTMDDAYKVEEVQRLPLSPSCSAVDITESKDGGILKELRKEGAVDDFPLLGDRVTVTYDAMFADGNRFDSSQFRSDNKFEFILGKGDSISYCAIFLFRFCFAESDSFRFIRTGTV